MWVPAEIALKSYLPNELHEGMLFINRISIGVIEPYVELFELEEIPENQDSFMVKHGAPVKVIIITPDDGDVRATQEYIGWWDDGDDVDEYREVTLDDINYLLREFDGYVDIEFDDDGDIVLIEDKVVLSLVSDEEWDDWDETLNNELEE